MAGEGTHKGRAPGCLCVRATAQSRALVWGIAAAEGANTTVRRYAEQSSPLRRAEFTATRSCLHSALVEVSLRLSRPRYSCEIMADTADWVRTAESPERIRAPTFSTVPLAVRRQIAILVIGQAR